MKNRKKSIKKVHDYELTLSVVTLDFPRDIVEVTLTESSDFGVNQKQLYLTEEELQVFAGVLLNDHES